MKKAVSVLLVVVLLFTFILPAFSWVDANETRSQIPVIRISGDGEALYDSEGNKIFHYRDIANLVSGDKEVNTEMYKSMAETLLPAIIKGLAINDWDDLYAGLETEIGKIFANALLDENGNVTNGSGLSQSRIDEMEHKRHNSQKGSKGYFSCDDYWFRYDWRLDPMETADDFNSYIKDIKKSTGCDKVGIAATCLGTNVVMAYVAKYGVEDIQGIAMDGSVVGGAEILSEVVCAKFDISPPELMRVLRDVEGLGMFSLGDFLTETIEMLVQTGILEGIISATETIFYDRLIEGATSAVALSTFYTWPNYWGCVAAEDYEAAKRCVFGEEGSEKRVKYAGRIAKLDNYDREVRQLIPELIQEIKDGGANFGVISKYGFQMIPNCVSADRVSDQFASVNYSSFGATTTTVYETFSDDYIAQRKAEGKDKYISPDKHIDASTCLVPDSTWFIKGSSHSNWTSYEKKILYDVASSDKQLTVDDLPYTQFMVYSKDTDTLVPMTEENCHTEYWDADPDIYRPSSFFGKITVAIQAFVKWFRIFVIYISEKTAVDTKVSTAV
ncbi:MAG: hypothetical protein IJ035_10620 [Oscillospiraceae bacterium]|nr:hypothetical protein [Oscillospiraceae bacterium]